MEPNRFSEGDGKHFSCTEASTAGGRLVGPGEKFRILSTGTLVGGVSEPCRAGWSCGTGFVTLYPAAGLLMVVVRGVLTSLFSAYDWRAEFIFVFML